MSFFFCPHTRVCGFILSVGNGLRAVPIRPGQKTGNGTQAVPYKNEYGHPSPGVRKTGSAARTPREGCPYDVNVGMQHLAGMRKASGCVLRNGR